MTTVILFVFGAIVGSFLNVVGGRFNSGVSLGGRSMCLSCGKTLRFWELVPILSFLILRRRCSGCKTAISWRYPLIELWTGAIFATLPLFMLPAFCFYIAITVYDLKHKVIPDSLSYGAVALALIFGARDIAAGVALFSFFALIWLVSRGRALGFGDAKLALSIGILAGMAAGTSAVIVAFWIGAAVGIIIMIFSAKKFTIKSELPFAPFLILGAWIALALELDLLHVSLFS